MRRIADVVPLMVFPADPSDRDLLGRIRIHLERGGLLAYPTETVYGLGAAVDPDGVRGVVSMKGREPGKPILVLLPEMPATGGEALEWTSAARKLADAFWPGPLTLVLSDPGERFPEGVRSGAGGVAVRVSPHPFVRALLEEWGRPLLSTSANRAGEAPATTAREVVRAVEGRPGLHRLWVADGGPLVASEPSTVVDCTGERPALLRAGSVPVESLLEVISELDDRH